MGVNLTILEAGHCVHPKGIVLPKSSMGPIRFPASVAVIEHPREGVILFDTGYSERFFEQTRSFPNRLYSMITPVTLDPEMSAVRQLAKRGIGIRDVKKVILSHFHADHIGGAADFPHAEYIYFKECYDEIKDLSPFRSLLSGVLKGLLPGDFKARSNAISIDQCQVGAINYGEFDRGVDLLGDGSIVAVPLPGHVDAQMGLLVREDTGKATFLVADACWLAESFVQNKPPHAVTRLLFSDMKEYRSTLGKLHRLSQSHPDLRIIPCHCEKTIQGVVE